MPAVPAQRSQASFGRQCGPRHFRLVVPGTGQQRPSPGLCYGVGRTATAPNREAIFPDAAAWLLWRMMATMPLRVPFQDVSQPSPSKLISNDWGIGSGRVTVPPEI